jgi:hypothetical protein
VAHLVQESVAVLVLRSIPKQGNLDTNATTTAPKELPQLTASVIEDDANTRQFAIEDLRIELVKPSLNLSESRCHILYPFDYITKITLFSETPAVMAQPGQPRIPRRGLG